MELLPRPVTMMMCSMPEATHSSATYWICGLSTTVSISFGCALVAGRNRVPRPAAGSTALRTLLRLLVRPPTRAELGVTEALLVIGSVFYTLQFLAHSKRVETILRCGFESVNVFCARTVPGGLVGSCGVARSEAARVLALVESREIMLAARDHENPGD